MKGFDVVIFSNDKYLRSALCEEARLMGYSCGFGKEAVSSGSVIVCDISENGADIPSGSNIIYVSDGKSQKDRSLKDNALLFTRPFSLEAFSQSLRDLIAKRSAPLGAADTDIVLFDSFLLVCGKRIDLTDNEMLIFRALWQENGKAVSRRSLEEITGANGDGNMVAVYISRLRSKLEAATDKKIILTVRDVGYRLSK